MKTFINDIVSFLMEKHLTISTCESVTGGMIGSNLVNISGVSRVYLGGLITYSNQAKIELAKVNAQTITKYGPVSQAVSLEMAQGVLKKFKTDITLSITGYAESNDAEHMTYGLAYVTIILIDKAYTYKLSSSEKERNAIRIDFTYQALNKLLILLNSTAKTK
ncbi:MAG: CinA family protein [Mycoplasmataceae bacterium]|jgi:PncC family amidohydrolase|nr:CinA family protein [Mycoplasmataceae bacterium]